MPPTPSATRLALDGVRAAHHRGLCAERVRDERALHLQAASMAGRGVSVQAGLSLAHLLLHTELHSARPCPALSLSKP